MCKHTDFGWWFLKLVVHDLKGHSRIKHPNAAKTCKDHEKNNSLWHDELVVIRRTETNDAILALLYSHHSA